MWLKRRAGCVYCISTNGKHMLLCGATYQQHLPHENINRRRGWQVLMTRAFGELGLGEMGHNLS